MEIHDEDVTAKSIMEYLERYMDTCKDCTLYHGIIPWMEGETVYSDWENTDANALIDKYCMYNYMIDTGRLTYKLMMIDFSSQEVMEEVYVEDELNQLPDWSIYVWIENDLAIWQYDELFLKTVKRTNIANNGILRSNASQKYMLAGDFIDLGEVQESCTIIILSSNVKHFYAATKRIRKHFKTLFNCITDELPC